MIVSLIRCNVKRHRELFDSFCIIILCVLLSGPEPLCKVEKEMVTICAVCDCFSN